MAKWGRKAEEPGLGVPGGGRGERDEEEGDQRDKESEVTPEDEWISGLRFWAR